MTEQLTIQTGSRLHFGPLSYRPQAGRHFGGVGLMISEPGVRLKFKRADADHISGESANRIEKFLNQFRKYFSERFSIPAVNIHVEQDLPSHVGLGSGTQLAMGVAQSMAILSGEASLTLEELAQSVGRGARSAIGLNGFQRGGLFVDGGKRTSSELGTPIVRLEMPEEWCFLIVRPQSEAGLHGEAEKQAFDQLGPMPEKMTAKLCQVLVMELLPSIVSGDYESAGRALYEYGSTAGQFFAPTQGGIFAHSQMTQLAALLQSEEVFGVGQSSWGPTLFALMKDRDQADFWFNRLQTAEVGHNCLIQIAAPLNHGAVLEPN